MSKRIGQIIGYIIFIILLISLIVINNSIYIDSYKELSYVDYLFKKDYIYILVSLLTSFTALIILLVTIYYYFLKQKNLLLCFFAIFSMVSSFWCISKIELISYMFNDSMMFDFLSSSSFYIMPISIVAIVCTYEKKVSFANIISGIIFLLIATFGIILQTLDTDYSSFMYYLQYIAIIIYLTLVAIIVKSNDFKNKFFLLQIIILFIFGFSLELLIIRNLPTGVFITICLLVMFTYTIGSVVAEYVKKENYRTYLSEENARLSSSILLSQIKPHFLYNALNSISFLCKKDPKQADMAVIRFSRYLRQNMKYIEATDMVDFGSEMEHIKNYLYLESIRFPKMEIIYELKYIDFQVPPLCIQPIVENGVKHGVSKNTDGGYVLIKSYATQTHILIEVSDNGPGFDSNLDMKGTGLSNISRRLKMLVNAEIEFSSVIGRGTIVRVRIPREGVK